VMRAGVGEQAPKVPQVIALPVRRPLMPWFLTQVFTSDPVLSQAIKALHEAGKQGSPSYVGLFLEKASEQPPGGQLTTLPRLASDLHNVGTLASMQTLAQTPEGGVVAWFMAHRRIRIEEVLQEGPPPVVRLHHIDQDRSQLRSDMVKALTNEIVSVIRELVRINPMFREQMAYFTERVEVHDAFRLADFAASTTTADAEDIQHVVEATNLEERLTLALQLMRKELEVSKLQAKIQSRVDESMKETQRKYFLMEQMKTIKKELGLEKDDKDALVQKFEERAAALTMPETAREVFNEELDKLRVLERNSNEFNVTRGYLDWLTALPWGVFSVDNFDLERARRILDEDHYGMQDVKDRILEFIAVGKLKGTVQGKIICLVGPPGVGKTSIGQSIARALDRKFYRFSVGGLSDVSEIKGHRRTYVGAMPGKLIQCLKATKVANPLVLIDEVDKMGTAGFRGDPASALLEMLDPNQNSEFMDHYLDTPFDASKVLFLCTANVLETIPGPLRDRMEVIDLTGYDTAEKLEIAKRYLEPKARKETGLEAGERGVPPSLTITDDALRSLIRWYCRESGVRNLEKHINKIFRKVALKVVGAKEKALAGVAEDAAKLSEEEIHKLLPEEIPGIDDTDWAVTEERLQEYVGKQVFTSDRLYLSPPAGVVMGLAYTSMGGAALYIEVTSADMVLGPGEGEEKKTSRGNPPLMLTGKMGDVMQESAKIAQTFSRKFLHHLDPSNRNLDTATLHLHVPEGAVPKDGPSAGCTMVTALLSLAMDKPVRSDLAMTGEITLTGKVLPVGGIREKLMAAKRAGVTCIVLPANNRKDVDELPGHAVEGLEIHFATEYEDVFRVAFGEVPPTAAADQLRDAESSRV
jgi:ATP-dependent Lon protease